MKIVQINTTCGVGSTGKICLEISRLLTRENIENYILYSFESNDYDLGIKCSNKYYIKIQALISRVLGNYGFNSYLATRKMIDELGKIDPDIVHIHNIHGHDCNLIMLFEYLKKSNKKVIWTFHDCWPFTAYCTHFQYHKCNMWKNECKKCVQVSKYSWLIDRSNYIFNLKKRLFADLDITIITPSVWLANIIRSSFFKNKSVHVINNGINLNVFKPSEKSIRKKYKIDEEKFIILGVSYGWDEKKGFDVFCELAERLDFQKFQIILVGTNGKLDKKLPSNIISIHRTYNQSELVEIYTAADLFVNPTREDNYPTVNMEAIACGTPVVTFNTGGSPEMINSTTGVVVPKDDIDAMENAIKQIYMDRRFSSEECVDYAKKFDAKDCFKKYINMYKTI